MKTVLVICLLFFSGCLSRVPLVKSSLPRGSAAPVMPVVPFERVDADSNGTIDRLEYYKISKQINTEDPIWGLLLILFAVIFCTVASSFMLRPKK